MMTGGVVPEANIGSLDSRPPCFLGGGTSAGGVGGTVGAADPLPAGAGVGAGAGAAGLMTPMLARVAAGSPLTGMEPQSLIVPAQTKTTPRASRSRKGAPQRLQELDAMVDLRRRAVITPFIVLYLRKNVGGIDTIG